MNEKLLELKMTKCTLFLTETEINKLLAQQPKLWETALKRGKGILRNRQHEGRKEKKYHERQ